HVVNAKARFTNAISGDKVIVSKGEIHPVPFTADVIGENSVSLCFPQMDTVSPKSRWQFIASSNFVLLDRTSIDASQVNPETVTLHSEMTHHDDRGGDHDSGIKAA